MNKSNYSVAVETLYGERENSLILGLTGRTGAGCSTIASILKMTVEEINLQYSNIIDELSINSEKAALNAEKMKFDIVVHYMKDRWEPFTVIEGSSVILSFVLEKEQKDLSNYIRSLCLVEEGVGLSIAKYDELLHKLENFLPWFEEARKLPKLTEISHIHGNKIIDALYNFYINSLPIYKKSIRDLLNQFSCKEFESGNGKNYREVEVDLYSTLWQRMGNNIRSSGDPFCDDFLQNKYLDFAKRLDNIIYLIQIWNENHNIKSKRICIDAIRNSYESNYLKTKHRNYYLIAVNTDELNRLERFDMRRSARSALDDMEYSSVKVEQQFYHQDLGTCFQKADIHLYNKNDVNKTYIFTKWQIFRYVALMMHPGLITPTHLERCMQLAYVTKLNSGCLSRQVGAIVTDRDYSVKSVGWNDVPHGQVSCNLRNVDSYCSGSHPECYSEYEVGNASFKRCITSLNKEINSKDDVLDGRKYAYCFKDIYNGITNTNNQVHTRALHAEENAFLQIAKYGGEGLQDGILFCTASPCELCSKKAYQLGIRKIYYIDPYPGISQKHILSFGRSKNNPNMAQYRGAIGDAYIGLYQQIMPPKDELELITGINCKKTAHESIYGEEEKNLTLYYKYVSVDVWCKFHNRLNIDCIRKYVIKIEQDIPQVIPKKFRWTGSEYLCTTAESGVDEDGKNVVEEIEDIEDEKSPYKYKIKFNRVLKAGETITLVIVTKLLDSGETMKPYLAHAVNNPCEKLTLHLEYPKDLKIDRSSIVNNRYATDSMKIKYNTTDESEKIEYEETDNEIKCLLNIDNPILFYTYSIEWNFK